MSRIILIATLLSIACLAGAEETPGPAPTGTNSAENYKKLGEQIKAAPGSGNELVKSGQFYFPRLQFQNLKPVNKPWDIWPQGDQKLRDAIKKMSNINILTDPIVVNLDKPDELFRYPFVFMTSEGAFSVSEKNMKTAREYLLKGGFLYADDCTRDQVGDDFYKSFVEQMGKIFPENPMRPIPNDHEIFTCFFKMNGAPHCQGVRHPAMGLFDKDTGRLMAMVTSGDVHCGWVGFGNLPGLDRENSIHLGVNIVVYCLTH